MLSDSEPKNTQGDAGIFTCRQCGNCCMGYGGTYVTDEDIHRISAYIQVQPHGFVERFCRLSGGQPILAQREDGYCIFWDAGCTIHAVKPKMCRDWPYIQNLLVDSDNWNAMASMCPGMRKNVAARDIKTQVRKVQSTRWP
jgi:uncharacterized protein